MKYAVYWQPGDDIQIVFFKSEAEAMAKVRELMAANDKAWEDNPERPRPFWDITVLKVIGEVEEVPFDGTLRLVHRT